MPTQTLTTRCSIAGGGPAGMMLGFLLARAGVDVVVLEKHADFFRDFRGDTMHPSTLEIMYELGLLEEFLKRPHQEVRELTVEIGEKRVTVADFSHLPTRCRFVAFMPQWEFLNFLAEQAKGYPSFHLRMQAEVTDVIEDGDRIVGLRASTPERLIEVRADLVVGADGRHSVVRALAGLEGVDHGAPMDVLWMPPFQEPFGRKAEPGWRIGAGRCFVMTRSGRLLAMRHRHPQGRDQRAATARASGLSRRHRGAQPHALQIGRQELASWDDVKLLTVRVDRLKRWYRPGLLCIGDAAHAMSPVGGVGINLAIQDAVAAANILSVPLRLGPVTEAQLRKVQARREWPTRMTQGLQLLIQRRVISSVLTQDEPGCPSS